MRNTARPRKNRIIAATIIFLITGVYSCTVQGEPCKKIKVEQCAAPGNKPQ